MPLQLMRNGETSRFYVNPTFSNILFIEQTDHFTIDDILFPDSIPLKGVVQTQMSNKWMDMLEKAGIIQSSVIATDASSLINMGVDESFAGRITAVHECIPIPLECIVRGYYVEDSPSWKPYRHNHNMYGNVLKKGLRNSEQLHTAIYTPSTKGSFEKFEHDQNISFADSIEVIKDFLISNFGFDISNRNALYDKAFNIALILKDSAIRAYTYAHNYCSEKGIILADAKLEFGVFEDKITKKKKIVLIDVAFTPDTCRFWDKKKYQIGINQNCMDKHILAKFVHRKLKWNGLTEPPHIPLDELQKASDVYWNIYKRLFGEDFVSVTERLAWEWHFAADDELII